ncbi:hypothetical protein LCGC14_1515600 [marine sediment metagenome]|uniref:Uncharacterized protein n=1 Tax=marine sediment metagenome TaxID=412755 RepID=A0A0F9JKW3_9ZZZZ
MSSTNERNLRLVSVDIKNIEGLTTNLKFKSNLVIIYGYNRTGKTIFIKTLKYAFKGFRGQKIKLKEILGDKAASSILLVFEFNGRLYRIVREINSSEEYITFSEAQATNKVIEKLPPAKRKNIWSKSNRLDIIPKTKVLIAGANKNTGLFNEKLHELKLYPEIIDRLIAIENLQEFKNATEGLTSQDGGGYESIKKLLYEDLKNKDDAIEDITNDSTTIIKRLEKQNNYLLKDFKIFLEEIQAHIDQNELYSTDVNNLKEIVQVFKLDIIFEENLKEFDKLISVKQSEIKKNIDKISNFQSLIPSKKEKYQDLNNFLGAMQLGKLEQVIKNFLRDKKILDELNSKLTLIHRQIEKNPSQEQLQKVSIDLGYLFKIKTTNILKDYSLEQITNKEEMCDIPSKVNIIITNFKGALTQYLRNNELLQKNQITAAQIPFKILDYTRQLSKIKNPISFDPTDTVYSVQGRVEEEEGKRDLRIYMPIKDLKKYIEGKNPVSINVNLYPLLTLKDEEVSEELIKELTQDINETIDELNELSDLQKTLEETSELLKNDLGNLTEIINNISEANAIVESWREYITSYKSLAVEFIVKNLKIPKRQLKDFKVIEQNLKIIESNSDQELESEHDSMALEYNEGNSLLDNLHLFSEYLDKSFEYSNLVYGVAINMSKTVSENQEKYKKLCKDMTLNRNLKDFILPTLQTVCKQIRKNIHLDKIGQNLMNDIIKHAQHFYYQITGEDFLIFKRNDSNDNIYLKPYLKKKGGVEIPIQDPSGSEQASVALGIMTALAKQFHAFIIIDETTNSFDFDTQLDFLKAIREVSENIFWIIVILVRTDRDNVHNEFNRVMEAFPNSDIFQPIKDPKELTSTFKRIKDFSDFVLKKEKQE